MNLPSVLSFLTEEEIRRVTFVGPTMGRGLEDPLAGSTGMKPQTMAVLLLTMQPWTVVPVHAHEEKDKIYVPLSVLTPTLVVFRDDNEPVVRKLMTGKPICVPAGMPHFVKHIDTNAPCQVLVISSSQNAADIIWEKDANQLITKQHA